MQLGVPVQLFQHRLNRGGIIEQDPLDNGDWQTAVLHQIVVELAEAEVRTHLVVIFAQQIHDLPFACDVPDFLRGLRRGAGGFALRCFTIKPARFHEIFHRLLERPFAGVQIDVHADARGPITREPENLTLRRRTFGIKPGPH